MNTTHESASKHYASLIRIGGAALIAAFAIHIIANAVLKQFPPEEPTMAELRAYLEAEASTWAVVHGLRYLAIACLAVFLGGIVARVRAANVSTGGWETVGLVGGLLLLANLLITNGIETFAFLDFELLSEEPDLFWLVFNVTRVLFTAEIVTWAILIFGFSMAGWVSCSLPKAISVIGIAAAACGLISATSVVAVMTSEGLIAVVDTVAVIASLVWFLSTGAWMLLRGDS